ncbi:MAG: hypothetical protein OMM_08260 [Candidatus Magnetoglobus multicellularis str. Araruama]|uniref:Uncharacterized protein n=1 Tax=Candidatus Magnetoglobus multicellularis str. Araruama TaxID=890399 RepID=A0A1V1P946_9BACT|nr:MAG: hypothetical protein OMM_08260 [Candidatus Magnetoglobus multicellularis str. Araruama]
MGDLLKRIAFFIIICLSGFILLNTYSVMTRPEIKQPQTESGHSDTLTGIRLTHHYKEKKFFPFRPKQCLSKIKNRFF